MRKTGIACTAIAYLLVAVWGSSSAQTTVVVENLDAENAVVSNTLSLAGGLAEGPGSMAHGASVAGAPGSIALGSAAATYFSNTFVWSDGALSPALLASAPGQFKIHATNGIFLLGGPVSGNGSGLVSLCGTNILAGTIGSAQLADASITAVKLGAGVVGTNQAATAEWAAWGGSRFAQLAGTNLMAGPLTMSKGAVVSNQLIAMRLVVNGVISQSLPVGNVGIEGAGHASGTDQTNSVWLGTDALAYGVGGEQNVAVGYLAFAASKGSFNSAIGADALESIVGDCNQGFGYTAGKRSTGSYNSAVGWMTGVASQGSGNSAYGHIAHQRASGDYNTDLGFSSGRFAPGNNNSSVGVSAGECATGSYNTAVGGYALYNSPGQLNAALGAWALGQAPESRTNVAMGYAAGYHVTNGVNNVFIGANAGRYDMGTRPVTNAVALGAHAQVTASDTVVLGNTNQTVVIGGTSAMGANFVVTPGGDLVAKGAVLLRYVVPQGDLGMGAFTNCPSR